MSLQPSIHVPKSRDPAQALAEEQLAGDAYCMRITSSSSSSTTTTTTTTITTTTTTTVISTTVTSSPAMLPHVPSSSSHFDVGGGQLELSEHQALTLERGAAPPPPPVLSFPHTVVFPPSSCGYGIIALDVADHDGDVLGFTGWCCARCNTKTPII